MSGYQDLRVWQIGIDLVIDVYKTTESFPKSEVYGLSSQIRRSALSIPSNIAEGSSRKGTKEFEHFLYIAHGSLSELNTQLIIAQRIGYLSNLDIFEDKIKQLRSMISGLINSLDNHNQK